MPFGLRRGDRDKEPKIVREHDCVDWDSDDEGVMNANMHFESEAIHMEHEYENVDLDLHVNTLKDVPEVLLVATDGDTDEWRSVSISLEPDAAELLAEQLKVAAKFGRDGERADVRL